MLNQSGTKKRTMQRRRRTVVLCSVVISCPLSYRIMWCSLLSDSYSFPSLSLNTSQLYYLCFTVVLFFLISNTYPFNFILCPFTWLKCVFRSVNRCWLHVLHMERKSLSPSSSQCSSIYPQCTIGWISAFASIHFS
jgi:hypothetical protein